MTAGRWLKQHREKANLTQAALQRAIDKKASYVAKVEADAFTPSREACFAIAGALNEHLGETSQVDGGELWALAAPVLAGNEVREFYEARLDELRIDLARARNQTPLHVQALEGAVARADRHLVEAGVAETILESWGPGFDACESSPVASLILRALRSTPGVVHGFETVYRMPVPLVRRVATAIAGATPSEMGVLAEIVATAWEASDVGKPVLRQDLLRRIHAGIWGQAMHARYHKEGWEPIPKVLADLGVLNEGAEE